LRTKNMLLGSLVMLLASLSAFPQTTTAVRTNVPHPFMAGTQLVPAGSYQFTPDPGFHFIRVVNSAKKVNVMVPVLTRTAAALHTTPADAHVVFDKIGEKYILSELWLPGNDGYVLNSTKEQHEHEVEDAPAK
jgi:hypothetical protein